VGTIQWQSSTTSSTTGFTSIEGAVSNTYTTPALTATTYYRAVVRSGICSSITTLPVPKAEVFNISNNLFTFDDAQKVCKSFDARLATYDEIEDAYEHGADWSSYGWSDKQHAYFPTQKETWSELQDVKGHEHDLGRPGVNGGYFDPKLKFGVNCYGKKPKNHGVTLPEPLPGDDSSAFNKMVDKYKNMISSMKLSPFNRDIWTENKEIIKAAPKPKKEESWDKYFSKIF
jgi:hypothetical protein